MNLSKLTINENITIKKAIEKINQNGKRILLINDENDILKGVLTDGDLRRWVINKGDLGISVKNIINYNPIYITINEKKKANKIMKKHSIDAIPVVDEIGRIKSIIFWNDIEIKKEEHKNKFNIPVIIMAGGLGTRLYPYTKILPKPLIPIGEVPILERIIEKFKCFGCNEYYLTVNYKKEMIKAYFSEKEYLIKYIEEAKPLGTGGSLALLKGKLNSTFFLSNCDILIEADYNDIYKYHKEKENLITIVSTIKNMKIPYGIITLNDDGSISNMIEKPEYSFLTNAGMYVVEKEVLELINNNEFIHFTDIIDRVINTGGKVSVYSISEKCWMDMGQINELEEMTKRFEG